MGTSAVICLALIGCGTPPAKDFGGTWKPVNRYDDTPTEIPLAVPYAYYAAPMDGTLKVMLTRWSSDTGMKLSYRLRSDFTLPKAASQIHTSEARDAASQLSAIYAPQGIAVVIEGPQIIVEEVSHITAPSVPGATPPNAQASAPTPAKPATPDTK
ncbi:toxin co-regulated pilus biosynthesis Q family protein [Luteibacter anthropi]|nr:toxin co-regulated pilus biosynthesis Q family protein [Luteibacter anthropi]